MLESFNSGKFSYKRLTEEEQNSRGILGRLQGVIADTKNPTRNERSYSKALWEHVFEDDVMKEKIANRCLFGELGHPTDRSEVDMEKIAICMAEQPKIGDDGKLYGVFDIISTPNGRILKSLCDYGCNIGVSSRGTGDLYTDDNGNEAVDPDTYNCECFDAVLIPAVKEARLQYVTESLNKKRYNKTLRQSLSESLESASEEDKKVMKETLDSLGFQLDEGISTEEKKEYIAKLMFQKPFSELTNQEQLMVYNALVSSNKKSAEAKNEELEQTPSYEEAKDAIANLGLDLPKDVYNLLLNVNGKDSDMNEELTVMDRDESDYFDRQLDMMYNDAEALAKEASKVSPVISNKLQQIMDLINSKEVNEQLDSLDPEDSEYFEKEIINISDQLLTLAHEAEQVSPELSKKIQRALDELDSDEITESKKECNSKDCADKESDKEVVDDKSEPELVAEFQESLKQIKKLRKENLSLQEQLSVCNAKENDLVEQLTKYKKAAAVLSDTAKEVKPLKEDLNKKDKSLKLSRTKVESLTKKVKETKKNLENSINESKDSKSKVKDLTEKLQNTSKQLESSKELVGKYRKSYGALKESYLELKAINYGLKKEDILQNLNESYKIKDIDSVCEKLTKYKRDMNKLPFSLNENTRISIKSEVPAKSVNKLADDYISESLLRLADLK